MSQEANKNQEKQDEKQKRIRKLPTKYEDFDLNKKSNTNKEEEDGDLFHVKDLKEDEKKKEVVEGIKKQSKMMDKKSLLERLKKTVSNVKENTPLETPKEETEPKIETKTETIVEEKIIIKEELKTKSKPVKVVEKRKKETEVEIKIETSTTTTPLKEEKKEKEKDKRPQRKKVKFDDEKIELKPQLQLCFKILQEIKKDQWAWPFAEPVDVVALNIPDYYNVIKFPMDLKTVEKNLFTNKYETIEDFATDMRRIWSNCYTYNAPNTDISLMAKKLDNLFEEKLKKLIETSSLKNKIEKESSEEKVEKKKEETVTVTKKKKPINIQSNNSSSVSSPLSSSMDSRQMPFEEKKKLSDNISRLDSNKLAKVVEIIQSRAPRASSQSTETEIEIDLDKLDNVTLRQIEKYVKQSLSKSNSNRSKKNVTNNVQIKKKENNKQSNEETESSESSSAEETNSDTDEEKENLNTTPAPITQGKTTN